ncbi:hypothetical protein FRC10_004965 [Ceratobasidium sp. 414]|nr:hypothetical protein FRC10_004965 [Ceratobasidium sp. 414]
MSTGKSNNGPQEKSFKFLGAEYMGRKEVVRRSPNYGVTIWSIKQAFPKLRTVSAERIAISAFIEELGDTLHISEHMWPEVLPDLKRITVIIDSVGPDAAESQVVVVTSNPESSAPSVQQVPVSIESVIEPPENIPVSPKNILPGTLPPQPPTWRGHDRRHIAEIRVKVAAHHRKVSIKVLTKPSTTIEDLKAYIGMRLNPNDKYEFRYEGLDISDRKTVAELRLPGNTSNRIEVIKIEYTPTSRPLFQ